MQLHIDQSMYDPYLLQGNKPFGIVGLQTNNTLFLVDKTFTEAEQNKLYKAKFIAKEYKQLTVDTPLGAYIASIHQLEASLDLSFTA